MMKNNKILLGLLFTFFLPGTALADDPLPPQEAFKFEASVEGSTIRATWTAADDYYMYRDKIKFESATPGVELGEPAYPKGKLKHGIRPDGSEGEVETYMHSITFEVPVRKSPGGDITLIAHSQGCAEKLGICYPPQKREKVLTLAATSVTALTESSAVSSLNDLSAQLGLDSADNANEPLPGDQAFQYSAVMEGDVLIATWTIARDYYLYKDKIAFESKTAGVRFGAVKLPKGKLKHGILPDGTEGEVETYMEQVVVEVPVMANKDGITEFDYVAISQGCAEVFGICYPPQKIPQSANSAIALPVSAAAVSAPPAMQTTATTPEDFVSEQDKSAQILASGETLQIILYFFLGGLALAFTACMYPMIPILSSIIVGQGEKVTTAHALNLSLFYVLSMAVTFGVMGGLFAGIAQGVNLQAYFQSPWVLIPFSILFVALAMSMFGFYSIQMPAGLQGKLSEISSHQKGGSFIGVIIMGVLSALIIGPCAGPVIIGALAYAASVGDVFLGFLSMFVLGLGLGVPLIVVGVSHGKFLPKAGGWMDTVKYAAGVVLLAIALLFLERVSFIPTQLVMLLWATLFVVAGIYMGALEQIKEGASGWRKLWKGLGLVLILYGAIVMLGGLTGARNVNDPMHGSALTSGGGGHAQAELGFKRIKTAEDLQREIDLAKATGKYVMLDFYADWCTYCKVFEDYVFTDRDVQNLLSDFVLIQADVTDNDAEDQKLLAATNVIAPPAILFYGPDGVEKKKYRVVGVMNAKEFIERVNLIIRGN